MNFCFDLDLAKNYRSNSQKIRVMSESWLGKNIFCPVCGNPHICNLDNNRPVADFQCDNCGDIFELKSKNGKFGKKVNDGAYDTMIKRINSLSNPHLFLMNYTDDYKVTDLLFVPKFFFVDEIIEKRKPLSKNARRAGWTGCNILLNNIPTQGKISIIEKQIVKKPKEIIDLYTNINQLKTNNLDSRGWLMDVLNCVNSIDSIDFSLSDIYQFTEELQKKHINNNNIEAKIRQQLQLLRDKGFIEFLDRGHYKKLLL